MSADVLCVLPHARIEACANAAIKLTPMFIHRVGSLQALFSCSVACLFFSVQKYSVAQSSSHRLCQSQSNHMFVLLMFLSSLCCGDSHCLIFTEASNFWYGAVHAICCRLQKYNDGCPTHSVVLRETQVCYAAL